MGLAEHRDVVLQWLREDRELALDGAAARLCEAAQIAAPAQKERELAAKEYIKQLYASLFDQGILTEKTFSALRDYAVSEPDTSDLPRRLQPKNAYNLVRLLITAAGWLRSGTPVFEMQSQQRAELLAIKRGETSLERVLTRAEELSKDLEDAHRATKLPEQPDLKRAQALQLRVRQEAARCWLAREAGPFGTGAAEVPLPEWRTDGNRSCRDDRSSMSPVYTTSPRCAAEAMTIASTRLGRLRKPASASPAILAISSVRGSIVTDSSTRVTAP